MKSTFSTNRVATFAMLAGVLSISSAFAQSSRSYHRAEPREYRSYDDKSNQIGFLGGLGITNADASLPANTNFSSDSRTRLNFSAFYEHQFIPYLGFRIGADYAQRGFSQTNAGTVTDFSANYLEFPLQAKAQLPLGPVSPFLATGPYMGFLVGKGATVTANGASQDASLDGVLGGFEFGWDFGGGIDVELTRAVSLEANLRYSLGITDVLNNGVAAANGFNSLHLNSFQLMTGIVFVI